MLWTLNDTLNDFRRSNAEKGRREIERFRQMRSSGLPLKEVVRIAAESIQENGKRHPHQRNANLDPDAIPEATKILVAFCERYKNKCCRKHKG
jgi:hypothetical protein